MAATYRHVIVIFLASALYNVPRFLEHVRNERDVSISVVMYLVKGNYTMIYRVFAHMILFFILPLFQHLPLAGYLGYKAIIHQIINDSSTRDGQIEKEVQAITKSVFWITTFHIVMEIIALTSHILWSLVVMADSEEDVSAIEVTVIYSSIT